MNWLINRLIVWLIDWLIDWLTELIDWLIDELIDQSIDCLIDWLINWLIDWLNKYSHCHYVYVQFQDENHFRIILKDLIEVDDIRAVTAGLEDGSLMYHLRLDRLAPSPLLDNLGGVLFPRLPVLRVPTHGKLPSADRENDKGIRKNTHTLQHCLWSNI